MTQFHTRIRVGPGQRISGVAPPDVPPGEHEATINLAPMSPRQLPTKKFNVDDLLKHDLVWDDSISLRREDMYGGDGR